MNYVRIQDNQIVDGPGPCPKVWANINGFDRLKPQEQAQHGWFPFEQGGPKDFDPRTQKETWRLAVGPVVTSYCVIEDLTPTEIEANLESERSVMLARNAELRWQREVGGIEFHGIPPRDVPIPIRTDRNAQNATLAAALRGQDELWKCGDGEWHLLSAQDLALLSAAIAEHVRLCFEAEAEVASMIRGCDSFADLDEIDLEALWTASISE